MTTTRILRAKCANCGTEWRCPDVDPEEPLTFEAECWRCFMPVTWTTWEVAEVARWQGVVKRRLRRVKA